MNDYDDDDGSTTTCLSAAQDTKGNAYILTNQSDGESIDSFVYLCDDFDEDISDVVFDVEAWLTSMYLSPSDVLYLCGEYSSIYSNENGSWTRVYSGPDSLLTSIAGDGTSTYACGSNGAVCLNEGSGWRSLQEPSGAYFYGIHRIESGDFYVVGRDGKCFKLQNNRWQRIELPTNTQLNCIGAWQGELLITGNKGTFITGSDDNWRVHDVPANLDLYRFTIYDGKLLVAAGAGGIYEYDDGDLVPYKTSFFVTNVMNFSNNLFATGNNITGRFDGKKWIGKAF